MGRIVESKIMQVLRDAVRERKVMLEQSEEMMKRVGFDKILSLSEPGDEKQSLLELVSRLPIYFYFKIKPDREPHLIEAFEYCGLDPARLSHWRLLLEALVDAVFRHAGRGQKWTPHGYLPLLEDIELVREIAPATSRNAEIARRLRKRFPQKYGSSIYKQNSLPKLVGNALRSPGAKLDKRHRAIILLYHQFTDLGLHPDTAEMLTEAQLKPAFREQILEQIQAFDAQRAATMSEAELQEIIDSSVRRAVRVAVGEVAVR